jgi:DNA-binding NarL/FixJ family response regulator
MTSVLIADDEDLVRSGLPVLLSAQPGIDVVGEAADGRTAVAAARRLRPDVVLMDVQMPGVDGIAATVQLLADPAPPRVLVLTTSGLDTYVYDALRAGASGFLLKTARPEQLAEGVRTVAAGMRSSPRRSRGAWWRPTSAGLRPRGPTRGSPPSPCGSARSSR